MGRFAPEEKLEAADKGPEIIVPLDLLERVQCKAAKDLESWPGESKKASSYSEVIVRALVACQH